jgi:hypothetical protein
MNPRQNSSASTIWYYLGRSISLLITLILCFNRPTLAQSLVHYDLVQLLRENKLVSTSDNQQTQVRDSLGRKSINTNGILWLKGVVFKEGTVDIDLRGKNVFLQSFLGIAFHARDTIAYDVVYFCPFRFHDADSVTRKYAVKYMSLPDFSFTRLREEHPGVYENEVQPAPLSDEWFHATIVIRKNWIIVYVNHSETPSLKVRKLPTLDSGKIGLWSYSSTLSSDFANLSVS